jgi:hypothetical protein
MAQQISPIIVLPAGPQSARCECCLGDRTDPATGQICLRCGATGLDPDPAAPRSVTPLTTAAAAPLCEGMCRP